MGKRGWFGATLILLAGGLFYSFSSSSPPPSAEPRLGLQTPWLNESQFVVTAITTDLLEMVYFAQHKRPLDGGPDLLTVRQPQSLTFHATFEKLPGGKLEVELPVEGAIFDPTVYQKLTQKLMFAMPPQSFGASPVDFERSLARMIDLRAEDLAGCDKEFSSDLAAHFDSPEQHVRAALLLEALALREASGTFFDVKGELCRVSAHLALAEALESQRHLPPPPQQKLARATLSVLCNLQVEGLKLLEEVPDDGLQGTWKRNLQLRVTRDYRKIEHQPRLGAWQEMECFRAVAELVKVERMWERVAPREVADFCRLANGLDPGVSVGHDLLRRSRQAELDEISQIWRAAEFGSAQSSQLANELNTIPTGCLSPKGVTIIGKGRWANACQRHLCHAIVSGHEFLSDMYGDPEAARAYRQEMAAWSQLRLYPFVVRQTTDNQATYKQAQDDQLKVVKATPELVPSMAWTLMAFEPDYCPRYVPKPNNYIVQWHSTAPLAGTVLNLRAAVNQRPMGEGLQRARKLAALHALAPYDPYLGRLLFTLGEPRWSTVAGVQELAGPMLDYSPRFCLRAADAHDAGPDQSLQWLQKAAAIEPSYFINLADAYRRRGRESEAAQAYEAWVKVEQNEVLLANNLGWLVEHHEKHGKGPRALQLAQRAAATGSARGLMTLARLYEGRRQYDKAFQLCVDNMERYDQPGPLIGYLLRLKQAKVAGPYGRELTRQLAQHLPEGLRTFRPPAGPPTRGARIKPSFESDSGLQPGDLVVAVRGYELAGPRRFSILQSLERGESMRITISRGGEYQEVTVPSDSLKDTDLLEI